MIVLDTNVLSEPMRPRPDPRVTAWLDDQPVDELAITAITMAEILHGIARLPEGGRKAALVQAAGAVFEEDFAGRILPFDEEAAVPYAAIVAQRERLGAPIAMADAQIAAICKARGAALATRNRQDFRELELPLVDPWSETGRRP